MTNKDNGFRVRVHNENRMNTHLYIEAGSSDSERRFR